MYTLKNLLPILCIIPIDATLLMLLQFIFCEILILFIQHCTVHIKLNEFSNFLKHLNASIPSMQFRSKCRINERRKKNQQKKRIPLWFKSTSSYSTLIYSFTHKLFIGCPGNCTYSKLLLRLNNKLFLLLLLYLIFLTKSPLLQSNNLINCRFFFFSLSCPVDIQLFVNATY